MAFECNKNFSGAATNLRQQNSFMTSGIIFIIIPYCIIYCIRNFLLYVPIRKVLLNFLGYQLFFTLTVLTVTILFIVNLFLIVLDIFLIHQVLLITSAITPVSAIA